MTDHLLSIVGSSYRNRGEMYLNGLRLAKQLGQYLDPPVLDCGAGLGRISAHLRDVEAYDPNPEMRAELRALGLVTHDSLADSWKFKTALLTHVLQHLTREQCGDLLSDLAQHAERLVFTVPTPDVPNTESYVQLDEMTEQPLALRSQTSWVIEPTELPGLLAPHWGRLEKLAVPCYWIAERIRQKGEAT